MPGPALIRRRAPRDEHGAVAVTVALCMTLLCVIAAMVLDFGLIKVDRQVNKSAADSAVLAGLHAMDFTESSTARPYVGVCAALRFLKANDRRFEGVSEASGWQDGNGTAVSGNVCTDALRQSQTCKADKATWARYQSDGTYNGLTYTVRIQNGYDFADAGDWPEDSLPATTGDHATDPCMDLELTVTESRRPGLGSLATSSDLSTGIRTVGRVNPGPGGYAPAMLLLKRSGCDPNPVSIGGSGSFIHVFGYGSTAGLSQPGTIHSDNDGSGGCASNGGKQIFNGATANGLVAYAAPTGASSTTPDPSKPGQITSVAGTLGIATAVVRDSTSDVYGATGLNDTSPGTAQEPTGRSLVSRQPVDYRYLASIKAIVSNASGPFLLNFANKTDANASLYGFASCDSSGNVTAVDTYNPAYLGLFVKCNQVTSGLNLPNWKTIVFSGSIKPNGAGTSVLLPDARKVYIGGSSSAATTISSGASFQMHTTGRTASSTRLPDGVECRSTSPVDATDRALLVVKNGSLTDGGMFRACDTTVVLLGGYTSGCVPPPPYDPLNQSVGPAPTHAPCASGTAAGTGQLMVNGNVDWTAPNMCTEISATTCDGNPLASTDGWNNVSGPEDLALWTESAAYSSINARIGGTAAFNLRGVFMTPNFDPLTVGGGPNTALSNAQFIASALGLNGGAQLSMTVDPNSAVRLKRLLLVGLVR